jgi:hypothetical protein
MTNERRGEAVDPTPPPGNPLLEGLSIPRTECGDRGKQEERRLASRSLAADDPTGWFDELYAAGVAAGHRLDRLSIMMYHL